MLRGVENRLIRINILFYVYYKCVLFVLIIPRRKIKLRKRGANPTLSHHAWFVRLFTRLKEKKKIEDCKKWNCKSTPFHYWPISASLELLQWTLGDLTSHVSSPRTSRETPFRHWQSDNSSSGPDFEASTSIQELRSSTPEMWPRNRQQKPNNSCHLNSSLLKKKKERKKIRLLTSPKPSVNFIFLLPLCVYLANLFELRFVSDFIYK